MCIRDRVEKPDVLVQPGFIEERILLLIAEHLQDGFAEDGEIKHRLLRRSIGEGDLMRQGRFAATGHAGDDVERK